MHQSVTVLGFSSHLQVALAYPPSFDTHISKVHDAQLAESTDDLSTNLIGYVELRQAHLRRAEEGIFLRHDGDGGGSVTPP